MTNLPKNRLSVAILRWAIAGALLCSFACVDLIGLQVMWHEVPYLKAVAAGLCLGQMGLISVYLALGPGSMVVRLPVAVVLTVWTLHGLVRGLQFADPFLGPQQAGWVGVALFFGVVTAQVPLGLARWIFAWRITSPAGESDRPPSRSRLQFQLRHLLAAMLLVALALSPLRVLLPTLTASSTDWWYEWPDLAVAAMVLHLLMTVPCIWGAILDRKTLGEHTVAWLGYWVILLAIECLLLATVRPREEEDQAVIEILLFNFSYVTTVTGTLLTFRGLGFRLVREGRHRTEPNDTPAGEGTP